MASLPYVIAPGLPARAVVEGMRPRQWVKNAFVLAGVVFAGLIDDPAAVGAALGAMLAFCLASGAAYLFNDVCDVAVDRHDPRTAGRPLARGAISVRASLLAAAAATACGLGLALLVNGSTAVVVGSFVALQLAYSAALKHYRFVDVGAIATGFVLRAAGGAAAVGAALSAWLLVCTALLTLFLALAKRRSQLVSGRDGAGGRPPLARYSLAQVDRLLVVLLALTAAAYAAYSLLGPASAAMSVTVPFVAVGLVRAWRIVRGGGDPGTAVLTERLLIGCVVGWSACAALIALQTG